MSVYPKSIESVATMVHVDETGFTGSEKVALINAWNVIKANRKKHATEIFLRFFVEHSRYLKWFKRNETTYDNEMLHAHPHWVLQSFGNLIEEGLWDVAKLNIILSAIVNCHKKKRLNGDDMGHMTTIVNIYLKEVLDKYMTPTLEDALDKLCDRFSEGYVYDE